MRNLGLCVIAVLFTFSAVAQLRIEAEEARNHLGEVVTVCAKVYSARYLESAKTKPTLLNLGGAYPKQLLTVAIFDADRSKFPFKPEEYYPNQEVCVTGKLLDYKGSPEIIVQSPEQIKLSIEERTSAAAGPASRRPAITKTKTNSETSSSEEAVYDITLTNPVHLRAGPGTGFAPVTILQTGSVVGVIKSNNGWSYVVIKKLLGESGSSTRGYIKNSVLK